MAGQTLPWESPATLSQRIRQGMEQLPRNSAAKAPVGRSQGSPNAFQVSSVLCQPAAGAGVSEPAKSLSIPQPVFQEFIVNWALERAASVKFGMYTAGSNAS